MPAAAVAAAVLSRSSRAQFKHGCKTSSCEDDDGGDDSSVDGTFGRLPLATAAVVVVFEGWG